MAGAYAHLTMVNRFKTPRILIEQAKLPADIALAVTKWTRFVELGAVSPDYPYLTAFNKDAKMWADAMHYERVGDRLKVDIEILRDMEPASREKALVWLLGFSAHIATDLTVHPVVELKVGPYAGNATAHRDCEMHQDVYIFAEMNVGPLNVAKFLRSGIGRCNADETEDDASAIDPAIKTVWLNMLKKTSSPETWSTAPPEIDTWHRRFKGIVSTIEGISLPCFARHILSGNGIIYPHKDELDDQYLRRLATPEGPMDYQDIFDRAQKNVAWLWSLVAQGVAGESTAYKEAIHNWNLDTGRRPDGSLEFWSRS